MRSLQQRRVEGGINHTLQTRSVKEGEASQTANYNNPLSPITRAGRSRTDPPKPAARSLYSIRRRFTGRQKDLSLPTPTSSKMEHPNTSSAQDNESITINVPEELLNSMRKTCAEKASVSLLGRIQGKHPGLKALTAWARDTLHPTLLLLSLKANNLFEVTFSSIEGRMHALTQADLTCEAANITFSSWQPDFDAKTPQDHDQLDYPIWLQVVDLCQIMREESFLRTIGEHIGQVIAIDNSEVYRAKLFGPRIRILVKDLNNSPQSIKVPRLDREGVVVHKLEYSGFPNQCGRCRSRDHQVRYCPKKDAKLQRKDQAPSTHPTTTTEQPNNEEPPPKEHAISAQADTQKENTVTDTHDITEAEVTIQEQPVADHQEHAPDLSPQREELDPSSSSSFPRSFDWLAIAVVLHYVPSNGHRRPERIANCHTMST